MRIVKYILFCENVLWKNIDCCVTNGTTSCFYRDQNGRNSQQGLIKDKTSVSSALQGSSNYVKVNTDLNSALARSYISYTSYMKLLV